MGVSRKPKFPAYEDLRAELGSLYHEAYDTAVRLPGYNRQVTATGACSAADGVKVLKKTGPRWSREDHLRLAAAHTEAAAAADIRWRQQAEAASLETFGRSYRTEDYRISGIARDEFSDERKEALRLAAHGGSKHKTLAEIHAWAARYGRSFR